MEGRCCSFVLLALFSITFFACVFCDPSSLHSDIPLSKPSDGLSTASDTLKREEEAIFLDGLNVEQLRQARERAEKRQFQAEVDRMMKLIVNSLYKNKEIFLRELISNASDALDKIRVLSLTDRDALKSTDELSIKIKANKDTKTLHIIDTGIGMTQSELAENLGTIAKSGTAEFLQKLSTSQSISESNDLIGQFGVGFYSSFLVADRVMVVSKSDADDQYVWESGSDSFTVYKDPRGDTMKRGTEIILHLLEESEDYLQPETLQTVAKKYSQFVSFPIYIWSSRVEKVPVEPEQSETKEDSDVSVEEKKSEPKTVDKVIWDWVRVNESKPVWRRKPDEVKKEEYVELYKTISKDHDEHLLEIHFHAEGDVPFKCLLFVPKRAAGNVFQMHENHGDRIKLHVNRVFIADVGEEMLPKYLAFLLGFVDSDELPLNVSREMLQQNKLLKMIKKKLVRKFIDKLTKLSPEIYDQFWKEYASNIKLGIVDDLSNRSKLSKLLRFYSSKSGDGQTSLADYVSRMKPGQEDIYYITGSSLDEVKSSPLIERLLRKGYEVLFLVDPVDEYMSQSLSEYEKKKLQNVAKDGVQIDKSEEAKSRKAELAKELDPVMKWMADVLKDHVERVELSERLSDSPCTLVANQYGWSGNMERIMKAQTYHKASDPASMFYSTMKKIMEINPRHPIIKELNARVKADKDDSEAKKTTLLLYDLATLRAGYSVSNPVSFAERIESVMRQNLNVGEDEKPDEEPVDLTETYENNKTDEEVSEKPSSFSSPEKQEETAQNKTSDENTNELSEFDSLVHMNLESSINEAELNNLYKNEASCPTCRKLLTLKSHDYTFEEDDMLDFTNEEYDDLDEMDDGEEELDEGEPISQLGRKLLAEMPKSKQTLKSNKVKSEKPLTKLASTNSKLKETKSKTKETVNKPINKHGVINEKKLDKKIPTDTKSKKPTPLAQSSKSGTLKPASKSVKISGNVNDHDCDGIPDDIDEDVDNDGLLDRTQDSDWDGTLNHLDEDDDNDGIPDIEDEDSNGDGMPDCRTDVSDNKLKMRFGSKMRKVDSDYDGIPDEDDRDDDDDGIPDIMEDENKDQIPDAFGLSREDFMKKVNVHQLHKRMNQRGWFDHDCDGIPDHLDPDDDNDGYFDNKQDSDRDGILNEFDDDDDNDGIPDNEDLDSNGDGKPDCIIKDFDEDHIPDHIDIDDDNDGIPDLQDPDHPNFNYFKDVDKDGIPDVLDRDDDNDGIPDHLDYDSGGDGSADDYRDTDSDGVPDSVDDDMNNDGIPDHLQDHDCDGIPDLIDPDDDNDGFFDNKQDSDKDGILNEWDDDDDNDGIPDTEDEDSNGDGLIDCVPRDSDGDGIPDHLDDDDDNDGIPDVNDPDSMSFLLYKNKKFLEAVPVESRLSRIRSQMRIFVKKYPNGYCPQEQLENVEIADADEARKQANQMNVDLGDPKDKDCDGIPDHIDNDMDNDGKIDRTQDSDWDGILNHIDDDDDNDGIPDQLDPDANGDGVPDCRRDDALHYKLVRSPSGLVKKVLRIRKPTQEEQHMTFMINEAKRKLIRVKAKLDGAPPTHSDENQDSRKVSTSPDKRSTTKHKTDPVNPKILPRSKAEQKTKTGTENNIQQNTQKSISKASKSGAKKSVGVQQQQSGEQVSKQAKKINRKLASYTPDRKNEIHNINHNSFMVDDIFLDTVNLGEKHLPESIGSIWFHGAAAVEAAAVEEAAQRRIQMVKTKLNTNTKQNKENKENDQVKVPCNKKGNTDSNTRSSIKQKSNKPILSNKQGHRSKMQVADDSGLEDEDNVEIEEDEPEYDIDDDDDNNGIKDYNEDQNENQILDIFEGKDSDDDGVPDYLDDDDDGDGLTDNEDEDDDDDGILDKDEDENFNQVPDYLETEDTDGDGIIDLVDSDDDNDNIPDYLDEDADGNGVSDTKDNCVSKKNCETKRQSTPTSKSNDVSQNRPKHAGPPKLKPNQVRKQNIKDDDNEEEEEEDSGHDENDDDDNDGDNDDDDEPEKMSKTRSVVLSVLRKIENIFGVEEDNNDHTGASGHSEDEENED